MTTNFANAILYYPCTETAGTVCADASGFGFDGTYIGAITYQQGVNVLDDTNPNSVGMIYTTTNSAATCIYRATSPLSGDGGVNGQTWEVWIRPNTIFSSSGIYANILQQRNTQSSVGLADETGTLRIAVDSAGIRVYLGSGSGLTIIMNPSVTIDTCPHQVTLTRLKTDAWRLYWDGVQVANSTSNLTYSVTPNQLSFGADYEDIRRLTSTPSEWEAFSGRIGPVYMRAVAEDATTILTRHNSAFPCGGTSGWNVNLMGMTVGGQW